MKAVGWGRFVRDPELRQVGDTCVCEFSLAMDEFRKVKGGERRKFTNYFDFVIWDKAAELVAQYCQKGSPIYFEASPKQEKWETDGIKKSKIVFRVDNFQFLPGGPRHDSKPEPAEEEAETADF